MWEKGLDDPTGPVVLVAHDFYSGEEEECRIIPLPVPDRSSPFVRRTLTTSGGEGDVIYVEISGRKSKVLKLNLKCENSDGEWWQLTRKKDDLDFIRKPRLGVIVKVVGA